MKSMFPTNSVQSLETRLLLDGILERYGYDLHQYDLDAILDRVSAEVSSAKLQTVSRFTERILRDEEFFQKFLGRFTPRATSLFEDVAFFGKVKTEIIPLLRTYPFVRIWHVGANAPDLYSLAILLDNAGLRERAQLFITDLSVAALDEAKAGQVDAKGFKAAQACYRQLGGKEPLESYFLSSKGRKRIRSKFKRNLLFFPYNLWTDGSPNEFHFIVCRGILDRFGIELKERALRLFHSSLCPLGALALSADEVPALSSIGVSYTALAPDVGIYRRAS